MHIKIINMLIYIMWLISDENLKSEAKKYAEATNTTADNIKVNSFIR